MALATERLESGYQSRRLTKRSSVAAAPLPDLDLPTVATATDTPISTEWMTQLGFGLTKMTAALDKFYHERPLMDLTNQYLPFLLWLLGLEQNELHDEPEIYMSRITYLSQEVADIVIFCLAILRSWQRTPNEQRILSIHQQLTGRRPIDVEVPEELVVGHYEAKFQTLQSAMEAILTDPFFSAAMAKDKIEPLFRQELIHPDSADAQVAAAYKDMMTDRIEQVLAYCFSLYTVMGKNCEKQILRKNVRNALKYPESFFEDRMTGDAMYGEEASSRHAIPGGPRTELEILMAIYPVIRNLAVNIFDGPVDPKTGKRAKWSNEFLYRWWQQEDRQDEKKYLLLLLMRLVMCRDFAHPPTKVGSDGQGMR
jgi:hypothetical protein